jgi:hypothetical protein
MLKVKINLSAQLSLTILVLFIKNIGSIAGIASKGLSSIGTLAAPFYILSHIKKFKVTEFIIIGTGVLFYVYEPYSIRVFLSLIIISLLFGSIKERNIDLDSLVLKIFLICIAGFLVLGLSISSFYDPYWFGNRYKFIYEDATLLGVYLIPLIALSLYYSLIVKSMAKIIYRAIFVLLFVCLILTYSRMYVFIGIAIVGFYVFFYNKKIFRFFTAALSVALIYFAFKIDWNSLLYSLRVIGDEGGLNLTGRGFIWDMFFSHFKQLEVWQLFTPTVSQHLYKLNLELGAEGHSVVENSYFMTFLCGGIIGVILLLWVIVSNIITNKFFSNPYSLFILISIMVVWYFDDSLGFPYSVFNQFFALYIINSIEKSKKDAAELEKVKINVR